MKKKIDNEFLCFGMLDVRQRLSYEITLVRQSVPLSVLLSLTKFS